jgi:hypothetical protein
MNKAIYWTPRILTIVFILFLALFALDSFEGDQSMIKKLGGFFIHLIPNFVLILILVVAWKHEWVGTLAFAIAGIAYIILFWGRFPVATFLIISGPLFLIAILFWLSWMNRERINHKPAMNNLTGE